MSIDRSVLRHVADLARIHLEDDELDRLTADMNAILQYVDALQKAPVEDQVIAGRDEPAKAPLRVEPGVPDPLLRPLEDLAPDWSEGFFRVPRLPGVDAGDGADPTP